MNSEEKARLAAVYALDLLDTGPEERFDRITRLSKTLFNLPIAIVSLMDMDRQWFKSVCGFDAAETPRDLTFCDVTIRHGDTLIISDATLDKRFSNNPFVTAESGIRFYAGYPIVSNGQIVGTFCIVDTAPRVLTADQMQAFLDLGAMAQEEIVKVALATAAVSTSDQLRDEQARVQRLVEEVAKRKVVQESLAANEERLRRVLETSLDSYVCMNLQGEVLEWNAAAEATFGWKRHEVIGRALTDTIIPERHHMAHVAGMARYAEQGSGPLMGKRIEVPARTRDGCELIVEMTINDYELQGTRFVSAFLHDISDRKSVQRELEEKQAFIDAVLDTIDVGVVACASDGTLTLFNRAARTYHGLDIAKIAPERWPEYYSLYRGDGATPFEPDQVPLARALHGDPVHNAEMVIAPAGQPQCFLLASGRRLLAADGRVLGAVIAMKDVTDLKESERRAAIHAHRLRLVTENIPAMIGHVDKNECIQFVNSAAADHIFQRPGNALIGLPLVQAYGAARYAQMKPFIARVMANEKVVFERDIVVDGQVRHYHTTYVPDTNTEGCVTGFYAMAMDITRRKESELRQAQSEKRLTTITDNLPVLIAYIDRDEIYRFANATYKEWFGVSPRDMVGKSVLQVLGPELYALGEDQLKRNLAGATVDFQTTSRVGEVERTVHILGLPDWNDGCVQGVYVMTTDITASKEQERRLEMLARSDPLTGLANRRSYEEKLNEAALRAVRTQRMLTLMFLDLDHFKHINDTLGHAGGDDVLKEFALRLRLCVRATDTVCRLAGDEFTIILEGMSEPAEAEVIATKLLSAISLPFRAQGTILSVGCSIGIACMGHEQVDTGMLARRADGALYRAKGAGRNQYVLSAGND